MFQTFSFANWGERKIWMWEKYDFNRFDKCERPRETKKELQVEKKFVAQNQMEYGSLLTVTCIDGFLKKDHLPLAIS